MDGKAARVAAKRAGRRTSSISYYFWNIQRCLPAAAGLDMTKCEQRYNFCGRHGRRYTSDLEINATVVDRRYSCRD